MAKRIEQLCVRLTRADYRYIARAARSRGRTMADIVAELVERSRVADAAGIGPFVNELTQAA